MRAKVRRLTCIGLGAVMAATFAAGNLLAFSGEKTDLVAASSQYDTVKFEDLTGKVDLSSVVLENLSPNVLKSLSGSGSGRHTVIVTLDEAPVLDRTGEDETAAEFLATYSGRQALADISKSQARFLASLSERSVDYAVVGRYTTIANAVALSMDLEDMPILSQIEGVGSYELSETYAAPQETNDFVDEAQSNPNNVYKTGIYDSSKYVEEGLDGSGMTVAILDTGLDYTHEAFRTQPEKLGLDEAKLSSVLANSELQAELRSAAMGQPIGTDDLYVSDKVPFAYDYADHDADVYPSYSNHGTHVAGIVAGQADSYTDKDGNTPTDEEGNPIPFRGVAPNAQLVICKVFTDDLESNDIGGATTEDILAALEDCITLGVDVINMSLGTAAGFSSVDLGAADKEGQSLNDVYSRIQKKGISLICAASNEFSAGYGSAFGTNLSSNPDSGTVGSPSTFVGALSVASINGQQSPFLVANGRSPVFYEESSNANSVPYDFAEAMLDGKQSATFRYVVIPGIGQRGDYTSSVTRILQNKQEGEKIIAVIKRGTSSFEQKVDIAQRMGADGVIIYNNVAGRVRMSLGNLVDPIPAISVTMDAGRALTTDADGRRITEGTVEVNAEYLAGPFMNDYSSWGPSPDLKLKPEVTAHGGEITSSVAGGYNEQSGTSMASPNLAGVIALVRSYLKDKFPTLNAVELTRLTNQIVMSTATTVYDEEGRPYSPRKQGSGLATLDNIFTTNAYLYTLKAEDNRPKAELGEDEEKEGVYEIEFYVKNFGTEPLSFRTQSIFMTETLSGDGLAVAEAAHLLNGIPAEWKVNGAASQEGATVTVGGGQEAKFEVTLRLSDEEKRYLNDSFENGMFVEGFLRLIPTEDSDGQCTLNLPFMGFYGDWEAAPMLDYDCFEISAFEQDSSLNDDERPQARVWATQLYAMYYNERYVVPMGSFAYTQDDTDGVDQVYASEEHAAISCHNIYNGETATDNYLTTTGIKALYAGLLRNAELVTYDLYDESTGELIRSEEVYRVSKAYSNGGTSTPAQVLMELDTLNDLGLVNNGKYRIEFRFYFDADERVENEDNTFSMSFYVDYEAPVLVDSRITYYNYKDGNKEKQDVYLELDIFDNHYPQAVLLCYSDTENSEGIPEVQLGTEYATPIYDPVKNGITTVSINITDIYRTYQNRLYVQIDDYALNHSVWGISFINSNQAIQPSSFTLGAGEESISLGINETHKVSLVYEGEADLSNFTWDTSNPFVAEVRNGEIVGTGEGTAYITVSAKGVSRRITVRVTDKGLSLPNPSFTFGVIKAHNLDLVKAQGSVRVSAGQKFNLSVEPDPWYYPMDNARFQWTTSNEDIAKVDQNGNVETMNKMGVATIRAALIVGGNVTDYAASVILSVQDPSTVSNLTLTRYTGSEKVVVLPDDQNIMYIGEEAFRDNTTMEEVVIPKTVTQINERAFRDCTALRTIRFAEDADLTTILRDAFMGCVNLTTVDLTNCKTITVDKRAFENCTNLQSVLNMATIGTMYDRAFANTGLLSADLRGLHISGVSVFENCKSLASVTTGYFTAFGEGMFSECSGLGTIELNMPFVPARAFEYCGGLTSVTFGDELSEEDAITIGANAFYSCLSLAQVDFGTNAVASIGDRAFAHSGLTSFRLPAGDIRFGDSVFEGTGVAQFDLTGNESYTYESGALYRGTTLVAAPASLAGFTLNASTTAIGPYAFSGRTGAETLSLPAGLEELGEGAFRGSSITEIDLSATRITEIPALAFSQTNLRSFTVPAAIRSIGASAFESCHSLAQVEFAPECGLTSVGSRAFADCTALEGIEFPASEMTFGDSVFESCVRLASVTLPSVTAMGRSAFATTPALRTVVYGENATATGSYNFCTTIQIVFGMVPQSVAVSSVTLSDKMDAIGDGAFLGCSALTGIDLKGAQSVGANAFAFCGALASVTGIGDVVSFGMQSFLNCTSLAQLDLENAESIGAYAFGNTTETAGGAYTQASMPKLVTLGDMAFYRSALQGTVTLPSTIQNIGANPFGASASLTAIAIGANDDYFAEDGVLYRRIADFKTGEKTAYELVAYPAGKTAAYDEGYAVYTIKEGTELVGAYAFEGLASGRINRVVFPYSVEAIGDGAFLNSGVTQFRFESIQAPVLLSQPWENGIEAFLTLYATNFNEPVLAHHPTYGTDVSTGTTQYPYGRPTAMTVEYPTNGSGYDNYVYSLYFSSHNLLGEYPENDTRTLRAMLEGFDVETVNAWATAPVDEATTAEVVAYSDRVKEAHRLYNNIRSEVQLAFLNENEDLVAKLGAVESALKPVKTRFGITVRATSLTVAPDSAHKKVYTEGECFDRTGLKLIVTYDDYSSEEADLSRVTYRSGYGDDVPLGIYNNEIVMQGYGVVVRIPITVNPAGAAGGDDHGGGEDGGSPAPIIIGVISAAAAAAAAGAAAGVVIRKRKKAASKKAEDAGEQPTDDESK